MKKLITVCNVVEVAELLKNINLADVQAENQDIAQNLLDSFRQALHEFKQPIPNKASQIEYFEKHIKDLISATQALFDILDEDATENFQKNKKYPKNSRGIINNCVQNIFVIIYNSLHFSRKELRTIK